MEGKELEGGRKIDPFCRVAVGEQEQTTRTLRSTGTPLWNQNLDYTLKASKAELPHIRFELRVYTARREWTGESLIGAFDSNLGNIHKQPDHSLTKRWAALTRRASEEEGTLDSGVSGFLRFSVSVLGPGQKGAEKMGLEKPSFWRRLFQGADSDSEVDEDRVLFSGAAEFRPIVLLIRIHDLNDLPLLPVKPGKKAPPPDEPYIVRLEVSIAGKMVWIEVASNNSKVNQEFRIPIKWPTIAKFITIQIFGTPQGKGKDKEILLGTSRLLISQISHAGELYRSGTKGNDSNGFLPAFGPAYLTFYGGQCGTKDKKQERIGSLFRGRSLVEIISATKEGGGSKVEVKPMSSTVLQSSSPYARTERFILFGSFFSGNMIGSAYKSDKVAFELSIGVYGNEAYTNAFPTSSRTTGVMPQYDGQHYYCMPWGSKKPCAVVPALFEPFLYRLQNTNILQTMAKEVRSVAEEVANRIGGRDDPDLASEVLALVDSLTYTIAAQGVQGQEILKNPLDSPDPGLVSVLDRQLDLLRRAELREVAREMLRLRDLPVSIQDASHFLLQLSERLFQLSQDPQANIPDIVIWMLVNGERVAFATIPAHRILFCPDNVTGGGELCGQVQACPLIPVVQDTLTSFGEIPALLQVTLWLGPEGFQQNWRDMIQPGVMRFYAQTYENEKRPFLGRAFAKDKKKPLPWSDEYGRLSLPKAGFPAEAPDGWEWQGRGEWVVDRTFDTWVDRDSGFKRFEDEVFEVQQRNAETGGWEKHSWTDFDANETVAKEQHQCPASWEWSGDWSVDRVCPGDDQGWIYVSNSSKSSLGSAFSMDFDCAERRQHRFRRRRWIRRRVLRGAGADEKAFLITDGDKDGWEFATSMDKPTHLRHRHEDRIRRRRWRKEIAPKVEAESSLFSKLCIRVNPKATEEDANGESAPADVEASNFIDVPFAAAIVFDKVHKWQLRAYIYQARDLFNTSSSANNTNTYARVVFSNRCFHTQMVEDSVNPMYTQTMVFNKILLTGSALQIQEFPPVIAVEVFADKEGLPPQFLGRCFCPVSAVATVAKHRENSFESAHLKWYPLEYSPGKFHGDLLAAFELYEADFPEFIPALPPLKKDQAGAKGNIYDIPRHIRPEYRAWNIQFLCWGVRNLKRYNLTTVRHPYVEFIVANRCHRTATISDATKNPNFEDPLMRLENVALPTEVNLSTPIQIQLRDQRSFGRQPLVGICLIKDFRSYEVSGETMDEVEAAEEAEKRLATLLAGEEEELKMLQRERLRQVKDRGGDGDANADIVAIMEDVTTLKDATNAVPLDWWSKFYASTGEEEKSQNYLSLGLELIQVMQGKLEEVGLYANFEDFCQTFPLYRVQRLKGSDPENCEFQGEVKGRLIMQRTEQVIGEPKKKKKKDDSSAMNAELKMPGWEFKGATPVVVRVYVVRARNLRSRKKDGSMSTFVQVKLGNRKQDSKKRSSQQAINPEYGEMFEFKGITIPQDKDLTVSLHDRRTIGPSVELGATKIDLENRLLSKWRGTVGLPSQYHTGGINVWRDQWTPLKTLLHYSRLHQLPPVALSTEDDAFVIRLGEAFVFREKELDGVLPKQWKNWPGGHLGSAKNQLALYVLRRLALVPEHVETRALDNTLDPSKPAGSVQMWVDIFPISYGPAPPPVDIRPRRPIPMQLRLVVWQVREAVCTKKSMDQTIGDLCVRAYISGTEKGQKTDVHYRSMDGSGTFNWRMVFNFDYSPWDRQIVFNTRKHFWRRKEVKKVAPEIIIELLDNNKFSKDSIIGTLHLNLLDCEVGLAFPDEMSPIKKLQNAFGGDNVVHKARSIEDRKKGGADPPSSKSSGCCCFGRKGDGDRDRVSLINQKQTKGWWAVSKKGHLEDDKDPAEKELMTGKIQLEIGVMEKSVADREPVGQGQKKPNHSPELEKPDRPLLDGFWLTSRFGLFKNMIWNKWKWYIVGGIALLFVGLLLFLFIYNLPGAIMGTIIPAIMGEDKKKE